MTEMVQDKAKLFAKVAHVMGKVRTLAKDGENTYDKYSYVTADSAFEKLGAAMSAVNLVALPSVIELRMEEVMSSNGKPQTRAIVHGQITLACGDTGETWTNDWWGEGIDRSDKSVNKAMTAMMKYHLLRLFNVGTGEDADSDSPDVAPKPQKAPQRARNGSTPKHTTERQNAPRDSYTPLTEDVSWDDLVEEADSNRAADKKAAAPFVWPTSDEALELCAGLFNSPELDRQPFRMIEHYTELSRTSDGPMTQKQYQFAAGLLDERYDGGHNAILSALCSEAISKDSRPGYECKKLIDWLKDPQDYTEQVSTLDSLVKFLKQDISQFELA